MPDESVRVTPSFSDINFRLTHIIAIDGPCSECPACSVPLNGGFCSGGCGGFFCYSCGNFYLGQDGTDPSTNETYAGSINHRAVCDSCGVLCLNCDELVYREDSVFIEGNPYCGDCVGYCYEHGVSILLEAGCPHCDEEEVDDDDYDDSEDDDETTAETIYSYSFKPEPLFFGSSPHNFYMGVEHELEFPSRQHINTAREVVRTFNDNGFFYLKSDSSISRGFEMVSHPFTKAWFDDHYPQEMIRQLKSLGASPENTDGYATSGIHIHVSKDSFTDYHLYKFLHFHYEFPEFIQRIAGRRNSEYASFNKEYGIGSHYRRKADGNIIKDYTFSMREIAKKKKVQPGGRYVAVNMQNPDTAELRYFRSTAKIERLRAYVQFVDAMWHYTKVASVHKKAKGQRIMSEEDFVVYLGEHSESYADILGLLNRVEAYRPD